VNANRIWGIATALVVVLVLALGWLLAVQPLLTQASANDSQRAGVEATNAAQAALVASMKEKAANVEQYRAELAVLRDVSIPGAAELPEFYRLLDRIARELEVRIASLTVGDPRLYGQGGDGQPLPAEGLIAPLPTGRLAGSLYMIPVTIVLEADPAEVLVFASALQLITTAEGQEQGLTEPSRLVVQTDLSASASEQSRGTIEAVIFVIDDPQVPPEATEPQPEPTPAPTPSPTATP